MTATNLNPLQQRLLYFARRGGERLLGGLLVLWAAATLIFFAVRLMPGDPVLAILGGPSANPTPETIAATAREYGLDKPLFEQYIIHIGHLLRGKLGVSYSQHKPVTLIIAEQFGATLQLTVAALFLAWLLVLGWTLLSAGRRHWFAQVASILETLFAALPQFWLAILLLAVFAFRLQWFPPAGSDSLRHLVLPALALALPLAGFLGQVTRESLEITLEQPFILSARTRGLSDRAVRYRHALRHSVLPGLSLSGWALGALLGGSVVVEAIFSRKGLGRQLLQAVLVQDLPLTVGITLVVATGYVLANICVDLLYLWVDPRLKRSSR